MAQKKSWTGVQIAQAVLTGLTLLFLMIPVVQMCFTAFMKNAFRGFKAGFTTEWIEKVLELYGDTIVRSLGIAVAALILCVVIGVPAAWILVREQRKRWAALMEEALILPLSVPGLAIGLGILLIWGGITSLRQSNLFILCGHVMFCLPFMVRSVMAVLRVEPIDAYEEASATLGASSWTTFLKVVDARHPRGRAHGHDRLARRIQYFLDAADARHEDPSRRDGRQLRLHASRGGKRLHLPLPRDPRSDFVAHAGAPRVACPPRRSPPPRGRSRAQRMTDFL